MSVFLSVRLFLGTVPFTVSGGSCGAALRPRPKSIAVVWAGVVVVGVVVGVRAAVGFFMLRVGVAILCCCVFVVVGGWLLGLSLGAMPAWLLMCFCCCCCCFCFCCCFCVWLRAPVSDTACGAAAFVVLARRL